MLQVSGATAKIASVNPAYISFADWNDSSGTFYVDNVTFDDGTGVPNFTKTIIAGMPTRTLLLRLTLGQLAALILMKTPLSVPVTLQLTMTSCVCE